MTLFNRIPAPLLAVLRQRWLQAERLSGLCQRVYGRLEPSAQNSRQRLLLRSLTHTLDRYRQSLGARGAGVSEAEAGPADPGDGPDWREAVYTACAALRDETWACRRMLPPAEGTLASALEGHALELEFVLWAMEYSMAPGQYVREPGVNHAAG